MTHLCLDVSADDRFVPPAPVSGDLWTEKSRKETVRTQCQYQEDKLLRDFVFVQHVSYSDINNTKTLLGNPLREWTQKNTKPT